MQWRVDACMHAAGCCCMLHAVSQHEAARLRVHDAGPGERHTPACTRAPAVNWCARLFSRRRVFTLLSYALGATGAAHVLTLLFTVWSVDWKAFVQCRRVALLSEAELVKVRSRSRGQSGQRM